MQPVTQLSLEQQFRLATLKEEVLKLSLEEAQNYVLELITQNMIKENLVKQWMRTK